MSEWKSRKLREVVGHPISGSRPVGGVNTETEGIPSLGGENVLAQGGLTLENLNRVPREFFNSMPRGHLQPLDVLINKDGAQTGKVGLYKGGFSDACVNEHLFILRNTDGAIDQRYLFYAVLLPNTQSKIMRRITGSAQPGLNTTFVDSVNILVPSNTGEQSRIAEILSTVDEAIEKTEALIAKYQRIKAGLMHDLFTRGVTPDGRLRPPRDQAPSLYKQSPLGWIPKEWETIPLNQICNKIADRDHVTPTYVDDGVIMVSPVNLIDDDGIGFESCKKISPRDHSTNRKKTDINPGDLILHRIGAGLGAVRLVEEDMPDFSILHSMAQIRPNTAMISSQYLLWAFRSDSVRRQISLGIQSIGVPDLGLDKIGKLVFPKCNEKEQSLITATLREVSISIRHERIFKDNIVSMKAGLMHDLLTGRVPVKVPGSSKAEAAA
jgi:type I restriction enzyme S subunit